MRGAGILKLGLSAAGALAITMMLTLVAGALASKPTAGATYTGHYSGRPTEGITFKVSANGKKVIDLSVATPFKCNGGCGGVGSPNSGSATINKAGKFHAVLNIPGVGPHPKPEGTDTVTGTFGKHGEAKGTVTSHFSHGSGGETVDWTAVS